MLTTCSVISITFSASLHFHTDALRRNAWQTIFTERRRFSKTHNFQQEIQGGFCPMQIKKLYSIQD